MDYKPRGEVGQFWNGENHNHHKILALQMVPLQNSSIQDVIKEGVLNSLKPPKNVMELERLGLPIPNQRSLYNKVAYIKRTLTKESSEFSTKDSQDWAAN